MATLKRNPNQFDWADDMAVAIIATVHGHCYVRAARGIAEYLREFRARIEGQENEAQTKCDGGRGAGVQHSLRVDHLPELVFSPLRNHNDR